MRRYLLSIVLVLFAATGIGSYFAYGAADRLPEFRLVTIQGDEAIGERIRLMGSYGGRMRSQFLQVDAQGSVYDRDRSIVEKWREQASLARVEPELASLIREHRHFLRGKPRYSWILQNLHKDEEWLIFAEAMLYRRAPSAWDLVATIEMLPLDGGKMRRYELILDQTSENTGGYLKDVARIGEELHLIVQVRNGQYFDYILDMNGSLLRKVNLARGGDGVMIANHEFGAFTSSLDDGLLMADSITEPDTGRVQNLKFYRYHYASSEFSDLAELAVDQQEGESVAVRLIGDDIAVIIHDSERVRWHLLSADEKEEPRSSDPITAEALGGKEIKTVVAAGNIAYLLLKHDLHPVAVAVDLEEGAIVYSGKVELVGPAEEAEKELGQLRLNNLSVALRGDRNGR